MGRGTGEQWLAEAEWCRPAGGRRGRPDGRYRDTSHRGQSRKELSREQRETFVALVRRRPRRRLRWLESGAVWAIDGTWLIQAVEGEGRRALVLVEVHGRQTLCVQ